MVTIEINEESHTNEDVAILLEHIMGLIRQGYTSGVAPGWSLSGEEEPENE